MAAVIPTRDRPDFLTSAIDSALRQTYPLVGVWVVDDGSSPPVELAEPHRRDPRVHLIRLSRHGGPGHARNVGVRAAGAPLIAFLDDDDLWRPEKIELQVAALSATIGAAACETGYDLWDGNSLVLRHRPRADVDLRRVLLTRPRLQPSTVLMRKEAFDALGGFEATMPRTEDWELWVRLADRYRIVVLSEAYVDRRVNTNIAAAALEGQRQMVTTVLAARIRQLPPSERGRVRSLHLRWEGTMLARSGDVGGARRAYLAAWRERPREWRPLVLAMTCLAGPRVFVALERRRREALPRLMKLLRREVPVRRW